MAKNEYIAKENLMDEATQPDQQAQPKKSKSKKEKTEDPAGFSKMTQKLSERFDKKKFKSSVGFLLILFSGYTFLACISYLFTWTIDQDQVLDKSLFTYLFEENPQEAENWLGKFGAWISHLFIYRWFGIASFGICFLTFLIGVKVLFNVALLSLAKTFKTTVLLGLWISLFLGFFSNSINYLGGTFGYFINQWLMLSLGNFGAFVFLIALFYIVSIVLFNTNYIALFKRFFLKTMEDVREDMGEIQADNKLVVNDFHTINTIKDEEIQEEIISETVHFDEDDEEVFEDSELEILMKKPKEDIALEDGFEIEIAQEIEEPILQKIPESTEEDEENDAVKEFGNYDPKLDLSSYVLPGIELLKEYGSNGVQVNKQELEDNKNKIVETLSHYKIDIAKIKATVGPTVTLYEIVPAPGVRISKIKNLEDDIALSLSALGIRIIAPIPGKGTIGIEVPNSNPEMVSMRSLIASEKFQNSDAEIPIVMGKTITNETFTFDLTKMPHLLVAGATGQGKSVGLNAILISILYKMHPAQIKFVLVDPKKVELTLYNKIERHFLAKLPGEEDAIITDTSKVVNTLNSLCIEMDERYELLKNAQVRTIKEYNAKFILRKLNPEKGHRYMPYIVVLIDEFADLIMTAGKEVEHPIARIAQLARAVGIHLIVATQRPSVNVITGMIKANFPARIAFRVLSKIDSRTILDASGADQLIGRGDMLISTGSDIKRLQCGFVDTSEVEDICNFIGEQRAYPDAMLLPEFIGENADAGDIDMNEIDPMFADAARIVVINQQGSASLLQRKLKLGYNRAGRIVDQLEGMNIIGPFQGSKAREVLYADVEALDAYLASKGIL